MSDPLIIPALDEDDPYAMANLRPAFTGLPMVVWVSERGNARHDVRVNAARSIQQHSVGVRPQPALVAGHLSPADLQVVSRWITLNADPILNYWNGTIDTVELMQRLRRLDPPIAL